MIETWWPYVIDELAYYSATDGTKQTREAFAVAVRDLVACGRAARGHRRRRDPTPVPDIIPTSLRDLFGYRWAFRCTTDTSSDIVLGHGRASREHTAARQIADQLGYSKVSMTQDRYLGRRAVTSDGANALDASYLLTVKEDVDAVSGG